MASPFAVLCWDYRCIERGADPEVVAAFCSPVYPRAAAEAADKCKKFLEERIRAGVEEDGGIEEFESARSYTPTGEVFWARQSALCACHSSSSSSSPSSYFFLTGGLDSRVRLWCMGKEKLSRTLGCHYSVVDHHSVTVPSSSSSSSSASSSGSSQTRSFSLQVAADPVQPPRNLKGVQDICTIEDGTMCLAAYGDRVIRVWDLNTMQ